MLFVFLGVDKPGQQAVREEKLALHRGYLRQVADRIAFAGPLLADADSPTAGSLLVIDFPGRKEAQAWIDEEPYVKAGIYESVTVRPFVNRWPQRVGVALAAPD